MDSTSPAPDADNPASTRAELVAALQDEYQQLAQQTERHKWLAHELHDGLLQDVLAARMQLEALSESGETISQEQVTMISELLERAILEARLLVGDLRTIQQSTSLSGALQSLAEDCRSGMLAGRSANVDCQLEEIQVPDPVVLATLVRVARESLVNAVRHSGSNHIELRLERSEDSLQMVISDRGVGFDASSVPENCFGLQGMQQRVAALPGQLAIESAAGSGTTIHVTVPLTRA